MIPTKSSVRLRNSFRAVRSEIAALDKRKKSLETVLKKMEVAEPLFHVILPAKEPGTATVGVFGNDLETCMEEVRELWRKENPAQPDTAARGPHAFLLLSNTSELVVVQEDDAPRGTHLANIFIKGEAQTVLSKKERRSAGLMPMHGNLIRSKSLPRLVA